MPSPVELHALAHEFLLQLEYELHDMPVSTDMRYEPGAYFRQNDTARFQRLRPMNWNSSWDDPIGMEMQTIEVRLKHLVDARFELTQGDMYTPIEDISRRLLAPAARVIKDRVRNLHHPGETLVVAPLSVPDAASFAFSRVVSDNARGFTIWVVIVYSPINDVFIGMAKMLFGLVNLHSLTPEEAAVIALLREARAAYSLQLQARIAA